MMRTSCAAAALVCALASGTSIADDAPPNYFGVMGSYVVPDSVRGTENGAGWHVLYGAPMNSRLAVELSAFGQRTDLENGGGQDAEFPCDPCHHGCYADGRRVGQACHDDDQMSCLERGADDPAGEELPSRDEQRDDKCRRTAERSEPSARR